MSNNEVELSRFQNSLSGAMTGLLTGILTAPIDVVKIRKQLQRNRNGSIKKYKGTFQSILKISKEEGIAALWKGSIAAQCLHFSYGAIQFYNYELCTKYFNKLSNEKKYKIPTHAQTFISGAISGASAVIATYPFDLLRTRFATQGNQHLYKNIFQATKLIIKNEGVSSLYNGVVPSVISIVPYIGSTFLAHELLMEHFDYIEKKFPDRHIYINNGIKNFVSGGIAGVLSKVVTMPFDTVRKVMQVNGKIAQNNKNLYAIEIQENNSRRIFTCMRNIYKKEGMKAFYKGTGISILKSTYGTALTFFILNECHMLFGIYNKRKLEKNNE